MRGIKAKRLRREALILSRGALPMRSRFYLDSNKSAGVERRGEGYKEKLVPRCWVITDMRGWKNEGTVRGVYRALKRVAA